MRGGVRRSRNGARSSSRRTTGESAMLGGVPAGMVADRPPPHTAANPGRGALHFLRPLCTNAWRCYAAAPRGGGVSWSTSSGCWTAWTSWSSRCTSTPAAPNRCATPAESTALGQSPIEFLKSLRLARAAQLLTHTDLPVKSVAARVGYSSRSSFTRAFVAHHRAGPTAFRIAAAHPEPRPPIRGTYMPMPGAEVA